MLREIEYFATLASIHVKDYKYPKKDLDEMWENVLLYLHCSDYTNCRCQFHDVLPGSSIEMVYDDASAVVPVLIELISDIH
jgi:alpha-mannosidase